MKPRKKFILAAVLLAAAACFLVLRQARPDYLRARTVMEKEYPVCVLGVSERSGLISGERAGIRNIYINWNTSFPKAEIRAIQATGAVPMITWEPYLRDIKKDALLPAIADGSHDAYIERFATEAREGRLFIRFAHEPNSNWYGWSGQNSGPEQYIKAFRRVKKIFSDKGCRSARFVFSVNAEDVPDKDWNRFENYYPGDEYADVIGLDAYNWGSAPDAWRTWKTPRRIFTIAYERTVRAFPSKPVFFTETATCGSAGDKYEWTGKLLTSIWKYFPAVKAVIWFDLKKECDWSLSPAEVRGRYYGACGTGRFECSPKNLGWLFGEK